MVDTCDVALPSDHILSNLKTANEAHDGASEGRSVVPIMLNWQQSSGVARVIQQLEGSSILTTAASNWAAAGFVDTDLSFLSLFELYGTDVAERRMPAHRVVEPLDVVEHIGPSLLPTAVHAPGRALGLH